MRANLARLAVVSLLVPLSGCGGGGEYEAYSLVRVRPSPPNAGYQSTFQAYEVYVQTQMELFQSPFVLNGALRRLADDQIQHSLGAAGEPALAKMRERLSVERGSRSEILRVSYRAPSEQEAVATLRAITNSLLRELETSARADALARLETLTLEHRKNRQEMEQLGEAIHRLATELGSPESPLFATLQELNTQRVGANLEILTSLKSQLAMAKIELRSLELMSELDGDQQREMKLLTGRVAAIEESLNLARSEYSDGLEELKNTAGFSAELKTKQLALEQLESASKDVSREIDRCQRSLHEEPRLVVVQPPLVE